MGTGFCDDSVLHGPTTPYTMERVTLIAPWAKSMSPRFKPKISLCRNPVDAARKTVIVDFEHHYIPFELAQRMGIHTGRVWSN